MNILQEAFAKDRFQLGLEARDLPTIFRRVTGLLVERGLLAADMADEVAAGLMTREQQASTAIGHAMAVPHAYMEGIAEPIVFFVRLARPINLGSPDGIPTRFLFFLLGPPGSTARHLDTLAAIARVMSDEQCRYELGEARSGRDLLNALEHFLERTRRPPEGEERVEDSLTFTGRFCGGLRLDVARRLPHYLSDFRDGLHSKCAASALFLYFACLAPIVTFGGVMAVATGGEIGAVENIVGSAICGVLFALVSGQPLIILGATGPLLIFTSILYRLCSDWSVPFLPAYACVGLWSSLFVVILAVTDASYLMRYFTRFTDEIFSALISFIFIYEAIKSLVHIFQDLDVKQHHDTALLSLLLALGTFYIAMSLSRFRRSNYLLPQMREFLADFGPTIALAAMTGVSIWLHEVDLKVLPAPDSLGTTSGRAWLINPLAAPTWFRFAAIGPALLLTVLVFLDQNITARIVNSPDHHLEKGPAYHLDLGVIGVLMAGCSMFGLPWLVAATVRSLNHVRSLATFEEFVAPDGSTHERVVHVRENRVTGLSIHLLIGLSLLLLPLLKNVPMAVLYGLFLYMGVVSISGNQFFERISLWIKDPDLYPVTHYIRRVPRRTIHLFTLLQAGCLGLLWAVKSSALGILFPIFIALLVPVRLAAGYYFSAEHLAALDAEEEPEEEATHWAA